MEHTFIFLYTNREPFVNSAPDEDHLLDRIKYWLGKSPGRYIDDIEKIISFPSDKITDRTYVIQDLQHEQFAYEQKQRLAEERRLYEQLKQKFEPSREPEKSQTA